MEEFVIISTTPDRMVQQCGNETHMCPRLSNNKSCIHIHADEEMFEGEIRKIPPPTSLLTEYKAPPLSEEFACQVCQEVFKTMDDLQIHMMNAVDHFVEAPAANQNIHIDEVIHQHRILTAVNQQDNQEVYEIVAMDDIDNDTPKADSSILMHRCGECDEDVATAVQCDCCNSFICIHCHLSDGGSYENELGANELTEVETSVSVMAKQLNLHILCYECKLIMNGTNGDRAILDVKLIGEKDHEISRLTSELGRILDEKTSAKHTAKVENTKLQDDLNNKVLCLEKELQVSKDTIARLRKELTKRNSTPQQQSQNTKKPNSTSMVQPPANDKEISLLDSRLKLVEEITHTLKKDVEKLNKSSERYDRNTQDVSHLANALNAQQKSITSIYEKEREKHIIVTGVPEEIAELNTITSEILNTIGCSTINPIKTSRLGTLKPDATRSRPILVTLGSIEERDVVLEKAKSLKGAGERFSKVYLQKDLHPDVRKEWNRLRTACKSEKEKSINVSARIYIDYKMGVLKKDGVTIDRYVNPFRTSQSQTSM